MSVNFASAVQPIEWLTLDVVERILFVSKSEILALVQNGVLSARGERISSASVDRYTATRSLFGKPAPETYIKIHGRVYREI
jgi:hypothetical protein